MLWINETPISIKGILIAIAERIPTDKTLIIYYIVNNVKHLIFNYPLQPGVHRVVVDGNKKSSNDAIPVLY